MPDCNDEPIIKPAYSNDNEKNSNNIFALNDRKKIIKAQETIYNVLKQDPSYEENLKALTTKYEMNIQNQLDYTKFDKPNFLDGINYDTSMMFKFIKAYRQYPPKSLLNDDKINKKEDQKNKTPNKIGDETSKTPQQENENNKKTGQDINKENQQKYHSQQTAISNKIEAEIEKYNKKKEDNSKETQKDKKKPDKQLKFKDRKEEEELKKILLNFVPACL